MNSFADIFELMKQNLPITDTARKLFIDPIKPIKLNNNHVMLYVSNPYEKTIINENYLNMFKTAFYEILGFEVEIDILTPNDLTPEQRIKFCDPIPELEDDVDMSNKLETTLANSNYNHTFDTFIVGDSNRLAYSACKSIAQGQTGQYNPLYIYSEPGLGKTHLLCAVKNFVEQSKPGFKVLYVTAETFVTEFVNSLKYNNNDEFKNKYRSCDMLLVDDVQFFSGKKESQAELFHTFNELHGKNKQIILTSDRPPKEINDIEERLLSRFEWGLLADIGIPEFETRLAIIKRKAELLNMHIPQNVMEYMADKLKKNIRQLEGAIVKMNALTLVTSVPPTISMAQNVIKDVLTDQQPIPVTVERIISEVGHIYSVTAEEMIGPKRNSQISSARQIAMYLINTITGLSYTAIGVEFGNRDHSTVVYAINKVKSIIKKDPNYRATIEDLVKNISNEI
ncbi:MAG: chromosomal replication initiator protein DnaA [Ruminococcaceae bacterium]|nr:chromosomal replication initiator protein DnaA [Oscillospiraceae bacterium]